MHQRRRHALQVRRESEGVGMSSLTEGCGGGQGEEKGVGEEVGREGQGMGTACETGGPMVTRAIDLEKAPSASWGSRVGGAEDDRCEKEGADSELELRGRGGKKLRLGSEEVPEASFQPVPCEQRVRFEELTRRSCLRGCGDLLEDGLASMPTAVLRSILEGHFRKPPTASWLSL